jgi:hypothetical protein
MRNLELICDKFNLAIILIAINIFNLAGWLRHYATNRKVVGSMHDEVNF